MNEAPRREPDSIVNVWRTEVVPAPNRLIAVAATGEPDRTRYAPSHPVPIVDRPLPNGLGQSVVCVGTTTTLSRSQRLRDQPTGPCPRRLGLRRKAERWKEEEEGLDGAGERRW